MLSKCVICNITIKLVDSIYLKCKCNNFYCKKHITPEIHNCEYDYKGVQKNKLETHNKIVTSEKLVRI